MKQITQTINLYNFLELTETAKEAVRRTFLERERSPETFTEIVLEELQELFPNSELNVVYSLSYCQGDGLNIQGELGLFDFLQVWSASEKDKKRMKFYLTKSYNTSYTFVSNNRYGYSCKHIDERYIECAVDETLEALEAERIKDVDAETVTRFFIDMIEYFAQLDRAYERQGYNFFYEADDEEIEDYYFDLGIMFTVEGEEMEVEL